MILPNEMCTGTRLHEAAFKERLHKVLVTASLKKVEHTTCQVLY